MMNKIFFIIIITQKFKMINKKIRDRQKKTQRQKLKVREKEERQIYIKSRYI